MNAASNRNAVAEIFFAARIKQSSIKIRFYEGEISLDFKGKAAGRGAYICRSAECFEKARKARRFEKAFSCKIEESVYEVMLNELGSEKEDV